MSKVLTLEFICDPAVVRQCSVKSLVSLMSKLPHLINEDDMISFMIEEWRNLPLFLDGNVNETNQTKFWCSVKNIKCADGTSMFPKFSQFMLGLLVLPHSSAAVERIFSHNNTALFG